MCWRRRGQRIDPLRPADRAAHREGILFLVIVVVAWGLTWPVNKVILESLSPLWMMALRSAIATVALFGKAAPKPFKRQGTAL